MLSVRLVIDTNVLISAALQCTVPLVAVSKPAHLYVSRPILEEYGEVLSRAELRNIFRNSGRKPRSQLHGSSLALSRLI
jgi:predicted nucleic acid-binding protein